jgi:NADH dehydrogenase (ubiquinone) 1 alpha subcomplex subunit 5
VGLKVDHDAIPHMIEKYQALLDRMANSDMPEDAFYRVTMEKVIRYRIKAAMDHPDDPEKVEELCNCGQVEELVVQAQDEMEVLEMYLKGRYWERVKDVDIDVAHDIEFNPDPAEDHGEDEEWGDTPGGPKESV